MAAALAPDLTALARASRKAGLLTLGGAVVVLASIGYSVWRLGDTETELAAEKAEVGRLKGEVDVLESAKSALGPEVEALRRTKTDLGAEVKKVAAERDALDRQAGAIATAIKAAREATPKNDPAAHPPPKYDLPTKSLPLEAQVEGVLAEKAKLDQQVGVLRKEAAVIREELRKKFNDPKENLKLWANPQARGLLTTLLVTPESTYQERNDPTSPTGKWYEFTLRLRFPPDRDLAAAMKRDITAVVYHMNHPYRTVAPIPSREPDRNFAVSYAGAGTLRNVVVTVEVAGLGKVDLDYDMTKAHPEAKDK